MGNAKRNTTLAGVVVATGVAFWAVRGSGDSGPSTAPRATPSETKGALDVSSRSVGSSDRSTAIEAPTEGSDRAAGVGSNTVTQRDDVDAPVRGCANFAEGCSFLEPDPETVGELARCGIVRYETPTMLDAEASKFDADWVAANSVTDAEHTALIEAAAVVRAEHRAALTELAVEAGIDRSWANKSSPFMTWAMIEHDVDEDDRRDAARKIAREQAGQATPPEDDSSATVAERVTRRVANLGGQLEQEVAERLGAKRARELHLGGDGWPGRRTDTASLCRAEEDDAPPPVRFDPSTREEVKRCFADAEGEGCPYLEPNEITKSEMARCGVVRFELPGFVMTRASEPRFEDEWVAAADLTDTELTVIAEVGETTRDEFYAELVALAVDKGVDEEWARQSPLLALIGEIGDGGDDRDTTMAIAKRIAEERGSGSPPSAIEGVDARAEAAYRGLMGFGDAFEAALAERLGPERARELRRADDGWPGNKAQTPSQCED